MKEERGPTGGARVFVGRDDLLDALLAIDAHDRRTDATDVSGPLGIGKSSLLREAEKRATAEAGSSVALLVDMVHFDPGHPGSHGDALTIGAALKNFDALKLFSLAVARALDPEAVDRVRVAADDAYRPVQQVKVGDLAISSQLIAERSAHIDNAPTNIHVDVDLKSAIESQITFAARQAGSALVDTVKSMLNEVTASKRLILLLDNVDRVADQEMGVWLGKLLADLDNAVVVLAHEPGARLAEQGEPARTVHLPPLSVAEVQDFLEKRLDDPVSAQDLGALVHRCSGGVPLAVEILADLIEDPDVRLRRADLETRLASLPDDPEGRLARVVTEMVDRLEGKAVGRALRVASIPFECDVELLEKLLAGDEALALGAGRLMEELEIFSFTAEYTSPDDRLYYVAVHPFVRRGLADRMQRYEPRERGRLHAIAAAHYFDGYRRAKSYDDMFGYESPEQQSRLRKWLYHAAHSTDPKSAMLQGAAIFLDAFWWWGSYVHFDFCDMLAADFEVVAAETHEVRLSQFADAVRRFVAAYPYRAKLRRDFEHGYPAAAWDAARDAVLELEDLCGVDELSRAPSELERHVKALLEVFLAHSHRYQPHGDQAAAAECYQGAKVLLEDLGEDWDLAWVVFEDADLALERGDVAAALDGATEAARRLFAVMEDTEPDEELIANLHRLRADCAFKERDQQVAAREYGAAVLHSYLFHPIGGPPDDYTMQFYFEMRGRALERLLDVWRSRGEEEGVAFAQGLLDARSRWSAHTRPTADQIREVGASGTVLALAQLLFPRGPELEELGTMTSPFMSEHRRAGRDLKGPLRRDLPVT